MLDWKEYVSEVHELIEAIRGVDTLDEFCAQLAEGLETTTREVHTLKEGKHTYVVFFGVKLLGKDQLRNYFSIQPKIQILAYGMVSRVLDDSQGKKAFVKSVCTMLNDRKAAMYFNGAVIIDNKNFLSRSELREYFVEKYDMASIQELCNHYDISLDGKGIVCDGIAYITLDRDMLEDDLRQRYPIEGYLDKRGRLNWVTVTRGAFMPVETTGGRIYALRAFQGQRHYYYRSVTPIDFGVKRKPYPVALLDEKTYAYYYK